MFGPLQKCSRKSVDVKSCESKNESLIAAGWSVAIPSRDTTVPVIADTSLLDAPKSTSSSDTEMVAVGGEAATAQTTIKV